MDIALLSGNALRIKGKNSILIVNPTSGTSKTEADGVITLSKSAGYTDAKIEGSRINVKGPGEYEVGGAKITAISVDGNLVVRIDVDSVKVLIGSGEAVEKIQDKVEGSDILVVNADNKFNYSALTALEPKAILAYGSMKDDLGKSLGKEDAEKLNKYTTTADKLPAELQLILLG